MIARVNDKPVVMGQFKFNHSLVFALKSITGDSENDIIKYFYELGIQLFNDVIRRKKLPQRCDRKVKTFYKNTNMQVKLEVWSSYFNSEYEYAKDKVTLHMALSFPNDIRVLEGNQVSDMLSETGLGLSDEQVTLVEKPEEKLYRCLRKNQA